MPVGQDLAWHGSQEIVGFRQDRSWPTDLANLGTFPIGLRYEFDRKTAINSGTSAFFKGIA